MIAIGSKASTLKNQLEQHVCLLFFWVHPLQQKTKTRKLEQCVIYLVLLSGDRHPVVVPRKSFCPALWIIFFSVVKRPVHLSLFWKCTSNFTLAAGKLQRCCPGAKEMENIHFLSFPLRGETEGKDAGWEREVLKSVGERTCVRL